MGDRTRLPLPDTQFALAFFDESGMHDLDQSGYTPDQIYAYSDAENAALRAELEEWRFTNKVDELDRHVTRLSERVNVLEDELRNIAQTNVNKWEIDDPIDRLRQFKEWAQNRARAALEAK